MNKSKFNYKVYNGKSFKKIFENSRMMILSLIFLTGIIAGAVILNKDNEVTEKITDYFNNGILLKTGQGMTEIFVNSVISSGIFIAVNVFFAFSLIGYPFILLIPFLKGLGVGAVCGYLYLKYGLTGFGYCVLTVFPGATVSTFSLISSCNSSCEYSKNAYLKSISGKGQFEKSETRFYIMKQSVFICISLISSLIDALFNSVFLRFFEF